MRPDPRLAFRVVEEFEKALCLYTGAPFCVTTDCGTNALYLCFVALRMDFGKQKLKLPKNTYVGVAQAARNAGHSLEFEDSKWVGEYSIPTRDGPIIDAAKWLRDGMWSSSEPWQTCLSFQAYKALPIGRGGAILCASEDDAEWFRKARFDGREIGMSPHRQTSFGFGAHMYMTPPDAARGLWLMAGLKDNAEPIGSWEDYPDLSAKEWT